MAVAITGSPNNSCLVSKAFVGGDNGRASFIAMRYELEEEVGLLRSNRQVTHLIHNHQAGVQIGFMPGLAALL